MNKNTVSSNNDVALTDLLPSDDKHVRRVTCSVELVSCLWTEVDGETGDTTEWWLTDSPVAPVIVIEEQGGPAHAMDLELAALMIETYGPTSINN